MKDVVKSKVDDTDEYIFLSEFREFLFQTIVPIKEMTDKKGKPLEKILAFWRRNNLIPFIDSGSWLKISFAQLIWLRILDDLRDINFPVGKMKIVCDYFFKDAYDDELPEKNLEFNRKLILNKKLAGIQTEDDEDLLLVIENSLKDKTLLYILKFNVNYLTNLLLSVIGGKEDGYIYIYFDGRVVDKIGNGYVGHKEINFDLNEPHIILSIGHYLKEFINNEELSTLLIPQLLNDDEIKVLREMRRNNIKEITIRKFNDKKGIRIESTKEGILSKDQAQQIKEILGMKNYERITIDTMDEKTLSFKMTRKKI